MDWGAIYFHALCSVNWKHLIQETNWLLHTWEITWAPSSNWTCLRSKCLRILPLSIGTVLKELGSVPMKKDLRPATAKEPKGQAMNCCLLMAAPVAVARIILWKCGVVKSRYWLCLWLKVTNRKTKKEIQENISSELFTGEEKSWQTNER